MRKIIALAALALTTSALAAPTDAEIDAALAPLLLSPDRGMSWLRSVYLAGYSAAPTVPVSVSTSRLFGMQTTPVLDELKKLDDLMKAVEAQRMVLWATQEYLVDFTQEAGALKAALK